MPYHSQCDHGYTGGSEDHVAKGLAVAYCHDLTLGENNDSHEQGQTHKVKGQMKEPPGLEKVPLPM